MLREGSEVVLFLYGVVGERGRGPSHDIHARQRRSASSPARSSRPLLYRGLIAIPLKHLFRTLTALITLLGAGLAAQAVDFLQQGGWLQDVVRSAVEHLGHSSRRAASSDRSSTP